MDVDESGMDERDDYGYESGLRRKESGRRSGRVNMIAAKSRIRKGLSNSASLRQAIESFLKDVVS